MLTQEDWFIEFEHIMFNQTCSQIDPYEILDIILDKKWWKILTPTEVRDLVDEMSLRFINELT